MSPLLHLAQEGQTAFLPRLEPLGSGERAGASFGIDAVDAVEALDEEDGRGVTIAPSLRLRDMLTTSGSGFCSGVDTTKNLLAGATGLVGALSRDNQYRSTCAATAWSRQNSVTDIPLRCH